MRKLYIRSSIPRYTLKSATGTLYKKLSLGSREEGGGRREERGDKFLSFFVNQNSWL
jgi:hypothetical protein